MKRIAAISVIVEEEESAESVNRVLHEYREIIIGRMGLPVREYGISMITVCVIGEDSAISALAGAMGRCPGVSVKASYAKKEIG